MLQKYGSVPFLAVAVAAAARCVARAETIQPDAGSSAFLSADDECQGPGFSGPDHCSLNALQRRGTFQGGALAAAQPSGDADCHDAQEGEECWTAIQWARNQGVVEHPEWYEDLNSSSSVFAFQALVHQETPDKCPKPCSAAPAAGPAPAEDAAPPASPAPASAPPPAQGEESAPSPAQGGDSAPSPAQGGDVPAGGSEGRGDCHDAVAGEACWDEIQWARSDGLSQHPEWYPGLDAASSAFAFQALVHQETPDKCPKPCSVVPAPGPAPAGGAAPPPSPAPASAPPPAQGGDSAPSPAQGGDAPSSGSEAPGDCRDAVAGEACWDEIQWARGDGLRQHPEWYPGLDASSDAAHFQAVVHRDSPDKCPKPCSAGEPAPPAAAPVPPAAAPAGQEPPPAGPSADGGKWCQSGPAPRLWSPAAGGVPMNIKVLSYNLFWWNLFGLRGGNGDSAGRLIATSGENQKYDFMGFQECEDPTRVLAGQGLLEHYEVIKGAHATCIAYSKRWKVLKKGLDDVAEDMETKWYGRRGAQWIRAKSTWDERTVFFVNHHGPLSVNSGGICGGQATAHNLLSLVAKHASVGDLIILVGDFNANAASSTIQALWPHLVHVHNSDSWGGIDNIFSNIAADDIISSETVGSGGSDHDAISAVLAVGDQPWRVLTHAMSSDAGSAAKDLTLFPPTASWDRFWCGSIEQDVEYAIPPGAWRQDTGAHDPEACCRDCQNSARCKSWTWSKGGGLCQLFGARPASKAARPGSGVVSGLTATEASAMAKQAAHSAITKE